MQPSGTNEPSPPAGEGWLFPLFWQDVCHHEDIVEANQGDKQGKKRKKGESIERFAIVYDSDGMAVEAILVIAQGTKAVSRRAKTSFAFTTE